MIRQYKNSDYELIASWWKLKQDKTISTDYYSEDCSFIYEIDNVPLVTASLYMMKNSSIACLIENVISNPQYKKEDQKEHINKFIQFLEDKARNNGFKSLIMLCHEDKLKQRWSSIGYIHLMDNLTVLAKSLRK